MTADDWVAVGTVAGVLVALGFGIAGLAQASSAKKDAKNANKIAGEANDLADRANKISKDALDVIASQDARMRERADVTWEWRWDEVYVDHVIIQNIGKSQAKNVVAQFFFDDVAEANDKFPMDIEGREEIKFKIPNLAKRRHLAAIGYETQRIAGGGYRPEIPVARTRLRVVWETPLGTTLRLDTEWAETPLVQHGADLRNLVNLDPDALP